MEAVNHKFRVSRPWLFVGILASHHSIFLFALISLFVAVALIKLLKLIGLKKKKKVNKIMPCPTDY